MCGLIGYVGKKDSKEILLKGLSQIQYRGYDSMGLVMATKNGFKRVRSVGDIEQLRKKILNIKGFSGSEGLGHSRWATHGKVTEKNAHPHKVGPFYLVHNGIIENAEELKAWVKGPFLSETDSEVVAHCLWDSYKKQGDFKKAVFDVVSKIKGEYAIAVMSEEHPGELLAFKKGPSLLVGLGKEETFVCSAAQGILPWTKKVVFLRDGEVVHVKQGNKVSFYSIKTKKPIRKAFSVLKDSDFSQKGKRGFPHYMLKEIYEQADCVSRLIKTHINKNTYKTELKIKGKNVKGENVKSKNVKGETNVLDQIIKTGKLYISACGSSYYSALYGKYVIEKLSRISVEVDIASEFRYRSPVLLKKAPLLLISQSGETADTLAVLKMAKKQGLFVLSLCNSAHSSLDREADGKFYMQAGTETGVASTKAFTSSLTFLFLLALFLGRKNRQLNATEESKKVKSLLRLPVYMERVLSWEKKYASVASVTCGVKSFIYLGRDLYYPLVLEGALKMKELTYRHSAAYPAGEMKHGPLALVDKGMAVVGTALPSLVYKKTLANLEEARCRGGKMIVLGVQGDKSAEALADCYLPLPACDEYLSSILCALPLQLIAYHTACVLGHNVDQPRNLAKSVTVE